MQIRRLRPLVILSVLVILAVAEGGRFQDTLAQRLDVPPANVGPITAQRFPPIHVPDGFKVALFACDPLVEYPSVIARGPKVGALFVAHDYLTGLGVDIVRRDEIRVIRDTDGDSYADVSIVFAAGFNSIQGLAHDDGTVYVMHAPLLSSLRDIDGDGVADEREVLLRGLGLPPENNDNRLHCANGVIVGHDGWLYLALGDRGCDVHRPEGDRLLFQQGGILRCRPDGSDLHVFAAGLRNIYDIALDDELNVFVRDNENDGGDYLIRLYHCFYGSEHGYPYHYRQRPAEAMGPMVELGRGSSAGGTCYLESAFPKEYRGNLFFCEWGRSVVRYARERVAGTFDTVPEIDFAFGADKDTYGFKPTDLVVDRDGSLIVSDWADGQRPKRGRARIYRISYGEATHETYGHVNDPTGLSTWIKRLNSTSYYSRVEAQRAIERFGGKAQESVLRVFKDRSFQARGRLHAIWILSRMCNGAVSALFDIAANDENPSVRAQAIRALADLSDPVLLQHRLSAGRGSPNVAECFAKLAVESEPRIVLEVLIALGRLRWHAAPKWLEENLKRSDDQAIAHAAMQTLRRADNWDGVLAIADGTNTFLSDVSIRAMAEQAIPELIDGLIARVDGLSDRKQDYADLLTRVHRRPGPWTYWGFRPADRPANTESWERTEAIEQALDRLLNSAPEIRAFVAARMTREKIPFRPATLDRWIGEERDPKNIAVILQAIGALDADARRSLTEKIVESAERSIPNRLTALKMLVETLEAFHEARFRDLARSVEDGPIMAELLLQIGRRANIEGDSILLDKLDSHNAEVRAAAIDALAMRNHYQAKGLIVRRLHDQDRRVLRSAAKAAGKLLATQAIPRLRELAAKGDVVLGGASLEALTALEDLHSVTLAIPALQRNETQLVALELLKQLGSPEHMFPVVNVASQNRAFDVQFTVIQTLAHWLDKYPSSEGELGQAIARVQGKSGTPIHWTAIGPLSNQQAESIGKDDDILTALDSLARSLPSFTVLAKGVNARVDLPERDKPGIGNTWLAMTQIFMNTTRRVEMLASSTGSLSVSLNGHSVYVRDQPGDFRVDSDRFQTELRPGVSQLTVRVSGKSKPRFHLRFRPTSSQQAHERLTQLALTTGGEVDRGREVFFNADKTQCIKCHQIAGKGQRIGPDLSGIGRRFSRIHLIESVLDPSRTIAPSYGTVQVLTVDGQLVSGVRIMEDDVLLTLGDAKGVIHRIPQETIEEIKESDRSTMPDGLEQNLTDVEFVDLISFLVSMRD